MRAALRRPSNHANWLAINFYMNARCEQLINLDEPKIAENIHFWSESCASSAPPRTHRQKSSVIQKCEGRKLIHHFNVYFQNNRRRENRIELNKKWQPESVKRKNKVFLIPTWDSRSKKSNFVRHRINSHQWSVRKSKRIRKSHLEKVRGKKKQTKKKQIQNSFDKTKLIINILSACVSVCRFNCCECFLFSVRLSIFLLSTLQCNGLW